MPPSAFAPRNYFPSATRPALKARPYGTLLRHDGENPGLAAAAGFDLNRRNDQVEVARRQLVQMGHVLQAVAAGGANQVVDLEISR